MTRSHFREIGLVGVVALAAACGDVTTEPGGVAGTYQLREVDGQDLPAVVFDGNRPEGHVVATALSGTMTLRSSTFTERVVFNIELNGQDLGSAPVELDGTYVADGQFLSFEPDGNVPSFTGTLSGGVLSTLEEHPDFGATGYVWTR